MLNQICGELHHLDDLPGDSLSSFSVFDCSLYSLDNNICSIPLYIIGFYINLYEQMNTLLQMFIFTLLTTDYDSGII